MLTACLKRLSLIAHDVAQAAQCRSLIPHDAPLFFRGGRAAHQALERFNSPAPPAGAEEPLPRVAILGRPNVGKSTLFNTLTRRRTALVYDSPGSHVTRDYKEAVAQLSDLRFVAIDTSGLEPFMSEDTILGRATSITKEMLGSTDAALLLVDGRAGVSSQDKDVANWLRANYSRPIMLVCNKMDHPENALFMAQAHEFSALGFGSPIALSAETKAGLVDLYQALQPLVDAHAAGWRGWPDVSGELEAPPTQQHQRTPASRKARTPEFGGWDVHSGGSRAGSVAVERAVEPALSPPAEPDSHSDSLRPTSPEPRADLGASDDVAGTGKHTDAGSDSNVISEAAGAAIEESEGEGAQQAIKLAIMGLPNVGKSTLFNHLMGFQRVLTGPEPGLTRDAVSSRFVWKGRDFELTDTAGWIRRSMVAQFDDVGGRVAGLTVLQGAAKMNFAHAVVLLVDGAAARAKIHESRHATVQVMSRRELDLAVRVLDEGRLLVVAVNKLDLLSSEERQTVMKCVRDQLDVSLTSWADCISVAPVSATIGRGVDKVLDTVVELHDKWNKTIATSVLNNWRYKMSLAYAGHGQNPLSTLKYVKMISTRPPTFLANFRGKVASKEFPRTVGRQLRRSFGMEGVPIRVVPMTKAIRAEQEVKLQRANAAATRAGRPRQGLGAIVRRPKARRVPNLAA